MKSALATRIAGAAATFFFLYLVGGSTPNRASPAANKPPGEAVAIVVNNANPLGDLSMSDLRRIFMFEETQWPNGRKISVVMREPGQMDREAILRFVYRMTESDYNRYALRATYTGQITAPPKTVSTADFMRKFVAYVPGAIGYLRAGDVDYTIKALRIDGLAPSADGYRIRFTPK